MAKKRVAVIALNHQGRLFRLNTIAISSDGSIHIISGVSPDLKGTYHQSGVRHLTEGSNEGKEETFRKKLKRHLDIKDSEGLMHFSVKDVNGSGAACLSEFVDSGKYRNVIKIDATEYTDLTVSYFLASKEFDTSPARHQYSEVFEIELENHKFIVATRNTRTTEELMGVYI